MNNTCIIIYRRVIIDLTIKVSEQQRDVLIDDQVLAGKGPNDGVPGLRTCFGPSFLEILILIKFISITPDDARPRRFTARKIPPESKGTSPPFNTEVENAASPSASCTRLS